MEKDQEIIRTSLRIPKGMYDRLSASAEERGLTMHADILSRLERSFTDDEFLPKFIARHEEMERELLGKSRPQPVPEHHDPETEDVVAAITRLTTWAKNNGVKVKIEIGDDDPNETAPDSTPD